MLSHALLHEAPETKFRSVVHHLGLEHVERMVNNVRQSCRHATDCKTLSCANHLGLPISVVWRRHHEGAALVTSTECRQSKFTQIYIFTGVNLLRRSPLISGYCKNGREASCCRPSHCLQLSLTHSFLLHIIAAAAFYVRNVDSLGHGLWAVRGVCVDMTAYVLPRPPTWCLPRPLLKWQPRRRSREHCSESLIKWTKSA